MVRSWQAILPSFLLPLLAWMAGCTDSKIPQVVSVTPKPEAVRVISQPVISATFDKEMAQDSLTSETFRLEHSRTGKVAGQVVYQERTAIFVPEGELEAGPYRAVLTDRITDEAGNPLSAESSWRFAVGAITVTVSWDPSSESGVNGPGGGYKVYYSDRPQFRAGEPGVQELVVPYDKGSRAPNRVQIALPSLGTYYFRVSAFVSGPGGKPLESEATGPRAITVP